MVEIRDSRSDQDLDTLKIQLTGFTDRLNIGSETEKGSTIGERQLSERDRETRINNCFIEGRLEI